MADENFDSSNEFFCGLTVSKVDRSDVGGSQPVHGLRCVDRVGLGRTIGLGMVGKSVKMALHEHRSALADVRAGHTPGHGGALVDINHIVPIVDTHGRDESYAGSVFYRDIVEWSLTYHPSGSLCPPVDHGAHVVVDLLVRRTADNLKPELRLRRVTHR